MGLGKPSDLGEIFVVGCPERAHAQSVVSVGVGVGKAEYEETLGGGWVGNLICVGWDLTLWSFDGIPEGRVGVPFGIPTARFLGLNIADAQESNFARVSRQVGAFDEDIGDIIDLEGGGDADQRQA